MMSKWLDAAVHMAVFHLQSGDLELMKPVSMFDIEKSMKGDAKGEEKKMLHRRVVSGNWSINDTSVRDRANSEGGRGFDIGASMRDIFSGMDDKPRSRAGSRESRSVRDLFSVDTPRTRTGSRDSSFGDFDFPRARAGTDPLKRSRHRNKPTSPLDITYDINDVSGDADLSLPPPKIEPKGHRRLQSTPESNRDAFMDDLCMGMPGIPESPMHPSIGHGNRHRRFKSTPEGTRDPFLDQVFSIGIPEDEMIKGDHPLKRPSLKERPSLKDTKRPSLKDTKRPSLKDTKRSSIKDLKSLSFRKPKPKKLSYKRKMTKLKLQDYEIMHDYQETLRSKLPSVEIGRVDGGWGLLFGNGEAPYDQSIIPTASWASGVTPSLFLQELAHLSSLCVAVALCTLRDDWYDPIIPMEPYIRKRGFPDINTSKVFFKQKHGIRHRLRIFMVYWFGMELADDYIRSYFHQSSPLPVLGGVSSSERILLNQARVKLLWHGIGYRNLLLGNK